MLDLIFVEQHSFIGMSLSIWSWIWLPVSIIIAVAAFIFGICYFLDGPFAALLLLGIGFFMACVAWGGIQAGINNYQELNEASSTASLFDFAKTILNKI